MHPGLRAKFAKFYFKLGTEKFCNLSITHRFRHKVKKSWHNMGTDQAQEVGYGVLDEKKALEKRNVLKGLMFGCGGWT